MSDSEEQAKKSEAIIHDDESHGKSTKNSNVGEEEKKTGEKKVELKEQEAATTKAATGSATVEQALKPPKDEEKEETQLEGKELKNRDLEESKEVLPEQQVIRREYTTQELKRRRSQFLRESTEIERIEEEIANQRPEGSHAQLESTPRALAHTHNRGSTSGKPKRRKKTK